MKGLVSCDSWGCKESDTTEQLNWTELKVVHVCMLSCFSCVELFATLWAAACQAPLSMGFSGQEYYSGLPCPPPPGDLPDPSIKPMSLMSATLAGGFLITNSIWEAYLYLYLFMHMFLISTITITSHICKLI